VATGKGKGKSNPPSRERYDESHPVISVRVSPEMRERLELLKNTSGMSAADVLRVGLDLAEPAVEEALKQGYEIAEKRFRVIYLCSGCGEQTLSIGTTEQKEAAAELMHQDGWYCPQCL
jgi:DNA-directed RNA polymerase subunit RPC12/RpoP